MINVKLLITHTFQYKLLDPQYQQHYLLTNWIKDPNGELNKKIEGAKKQ